MRIKHLFLCIFFLALSLFGISQNDSTAAKLLDLQRKFFEYEYSDVAKAKSYLDQRLKLALEANDSVAIAKNYKFYGYLAEDQGQYLDALEWYRRSLQIGDKLDNWRLKGDGFSNIGLVYWNLGDYTKALNMFYESLTFFQENNYLSGIASAYGNIGLINMELENFDEAIKYFRKSLSIESQIPDFNQFESTYNNLGISYHHIGIYDSAFYYFELALPIFKEQDNKRGQADIYINLASLSQEIGNYDRSELYYDSAYVFQQELNDKLGMAYSLNGLGDACLKKGKKDCKSYYEQAESMALELEALKPLKVARLGLANSYERVKDHKQALKYFKLYTQAKDSIFNQDKSKEMGRLEATHEFERKQAEEQLAKEQEEKRLATERSRKDTIQYSGIFVFVLILFALVFMSGKFAMSEKVAEGLIFFTFLLFFEFCLVFLDPYIDSISQGEPLYKLILNAVLAAAIFPLHSFFEETLKRRIVQ